MNQKAIERTVFIISDGTGITAETFSHSVLSQFESVKFQQVRVPFVDSVEKARSVVERINHVAQTQEGQPIAFTTLVNPEVSQIVKSADALFLDLFAGFVEPLEQNLGMPSSHSIGKSHKQATSKQYRNRIDAINYSLAHDDGQFVKDLGQAEVILVGVSRCGKTPTSLYLAMQYGVKAANFPLIPEDFDRGALPSTLHPFRAKLFGLTIQPERLAEVRQERRPGSKYASLQQCLHEVAEAERLMRMENIPSLSTTTKSIEEIATTILQEIKLDEHKSY
jgi:[pyruvate, water dikinase]-phosphate phosphotransferase / [pyruvate, water dikinase] kinase